MSKTLNRVDNYIKVFFALFELKSKTVMAEWTSYKNKAWYVYNGIGDPYQATSYRKVNSRPKCEQGKRICAIYASLGDIFPEAPLSANITRYIAEAMVTNSTQPPCIKKRTKIFVYLKD